MRDARSIAFHVCRGTRTFRGIRIKIFISSFGTSAKSSLTREITLAFRRRIHGNLLGHKLCLFRSFAQTPEGFRIIFSLFYCFIFSSMSIENMRNLLVSSSERIISFETCTLRILIFKNKEILSFLLLKLREERFSSRLLNSRRPPLSSSKRLSTVKCYIPSLSGPLKMNVR